MQVLNISGMFEPSTGDSLLPHSLRQREFLQLHCFLAEPLPPPDRGGPVGVGFLLLCARAMELSAWEYESGDKFPSRYLDGE
jgi:hypothetical protein